jgi:hypothetical protein
MTSIDDVLEQVARGELTPDEALALLETKTAPGTDARPAEEASAPAEDEADEADEAADEVDDDDEPVRLGKSPDPPPYEPPDPGGQPAADAPRGRSTGRGVRAVRVRTLCRSLEIYGDPAVAEVQVTRGSPVLRRDGDVMYIEHARSRTAGARFAFVSHARTVAAVAGFEERIVLRVNPDLLVDIDVSATSLRVWGCEGGLRLRLGASSAKLDRIVGPLVVDAHSSSIKGTARLIGENHLRCESSSVKLGLLDGTDVKVKASNRMGKVVLPRRRGRPGDSHGFATIGAGHGLLVIDATMSSVTLGRDW